MHLMDMSVPPPTTIKRLALTAILSFAGISSPGFPAGAEEVTIRSKALQAVPSSDIVTFRSPSKLGNRSRTTAKQTGETLAALLEQQPTSATGSSANIQHRTVESAPRIAARPPSYSIKRFVAPESIADMIRSGAPTSETNKAPLSKKLSASIGSPRDSSASLRRGPAFQVPSMEVLHSGRPANQDAVNFRTPDYVSVRSDSPTGSTIEAIEDQIRTIEQELEARSRQSAVQDGFEVFALDQLTPPRPEKSLLETEIPNVTSAIHANRLRELAMISLRDAKSRMQRRAVHSARKYALESLRLSIDVQDSIAGGNQHMRNLQAGLAAIRESSDFTSQSGAVSLRSMQRRVAVHETQVLKGKDLSQMSPIAATQEYLDEARKRLVLAANGSPISAEALVLLGKIESQMLERASTHSDAVSLTYNHIAVEISPENATAQTAYGKTLLQQGLARQAVEPLSRSLAISPSRPAYKLLLEASRRLGDADTARDCLAALNNPRLQGETSIKRLSPSAFASSYRPPVAPIGTSPAATQPSSIAKNSLVNQRQRLNQPDSQVASKPEKPRLSFRSLFSFGR